MMFTLQGDESVMIGDEKEVSYLTINKDESMFILTSEESKFNYIIMEKSIEDGELNYSVKDPNGDNYMLIIDLNKKVASWIMTIDGTTFFIIYTNLKLIN